VEFVEQAPNRFPALEATNLYRWGNAPALAKQQLREAFMLLQNGYYADSLEHYHTVIHLLPQLANAWCDGGVALFRLGRYADAETYYKKAIELDPKLVQAHTNLAAVMIETHRYAEALEQVAEALKLDSQSATAKALGELATAALREKQ
jgi:tetratricopeptide (TPR) repeat protein